MKEGGNSPESVANAVLKVNEAVFVDEHQVTGVEEDVAFL